MRISVFFSVLLGTGALTLRAVRCADMWKGPAINTRASRGKEQCPAQTVVNESAFCLDDDCISDANREHCCKPVQGGSRNKRARKQNDKAIEKEEAAAAKIAPSKDACVVCLEEFSNERLRASPADPAFIHCSSAPRNIGARIHTRATKYLQTHKEYHAAQVCTMCIKQCGLCPFKCGGELPNVRPLPIARPLQLPAQDQVRFADWDDSDDFANESAEEEEEESENPDDYVSDDEPIFNPTADEAEELMAALRFNRSPLRFSGMRMPDGSFSVRIGGRHYRPARLLELEDQVERRIAADPDGALAREAFDPQQVWREVGTSLFARLREARDLREAHEARAAARSILMESLPLTEAGWSRFLRRVAEAGEASNAAEASNAEASNAAAGEAASVAEEEVEAAAAGTIASGNAASPQSVSASPESLGEEPAASGAGNAQARQEES